MQLRLWYIQIDLLTKIKKENEEGKDTFYHFCGTPLPMNSYRNAL